MYVRSNQNAVAVRIYSDLYQITNLRTGVSTYHNGNSYRSYWNRHFRNSRQYTTPNGVRHDTMYA
jgi:hypothetical protein